jgi:hypothetical protein
MYAAILVALSWTEFALARRPVMPATSRPRPERNRLPPAAGLRILRALEKDE